MEKPKYNPNIHHRRSIRLPWYDYSSEGAYFVTVCTQDKVCLLGDIRGEEMKLSDAGKIVQRYWLDIPKHFAHVELDEFVIMPNHIHGIVIIWDRVGARHAVPLRERYGKPNSGSLPTIIRSFKSAATKHVNEIQKSPGSTLWQRGYYEHIIRDEEGLNRIRQYIQDNILKWAYDDENPNKHS